MEEVATLLPVSLFCLEKIHVNCAIFLLMPCVLYPYIWIAVSGFIRRDLRPEKAVLLAGLYTNGVYINGLTKTFIYKMLHIQE